MKAKRSRKQVNRVEEAEGWPRKVVVGHATVTVYRRFSPGGHECYMVANTTGDKRRFDSYASEAEALTAADSLAKKLNGRQFVAAGMRNKEASDYASAVEVLEPFKVGLPAVASTVAECLKLVHDLPNLLAAAKSYSVRNKTVKAKRVSDVVTELIALKEARRASLRYVEDLRHRLGRFGEAFQKDACNVTTAEVQAWLDGQKLSAQSYTNHRRVVHLFFEYAVARGYATDNPVAGVEAVKVRAGETEIYKPEEIARMLSAAPAGFVPVLAIGAFAGLRSAEIERIEWSDIDLAGRHIVVGASKAKTASRRVVPVCDTLARWLAPYAGQEGQVWKGTHQEFYEAQQETAAATEVKADHDKGIKAMKPVTWKANALRHSYASYRFAQIGDAGRVAGELGNSAAVVHRHYRELVKPADAVKWFAVVPDQAPNVTTLSASATV